MYFMGLETLYFDGALQNIIKWNDHNNKSDSPFYFKGFDPTSDDWSFDEIKLFLKSKNMELYPNAKYYIFRNKKYIIPCHR